MSGFELVRRRGSVSRDDPLRGVRVPRRRRESLGRLVWAGACALVLALSAFAPAAEVELSDKKIPPEELANTGVPSEPPLKLEVPINPFLGPGEFFSFELPWGAVWQPNLLFFGNLRTGVQTFDNGVGTSTDWANRLDLNANLQLSGTERLFIGFRPLDDNRGSPSRREFSGYTFRPEGQDGWDDAVNADLNQVFFEGDFGQIFPFLDEKDSRSLDWGFSVGRQPITFQEGMLVNDNLDAIGITRNTLLPGGTSNLRITGLYAWEEVNRRIRGVGRNTRDPDAHLFGLFSLLDTPISTIDVDFVGVVDEGSTQGDGFFFGAGGVQRLGPFNTALRINTSVPIDDETPALRYGTLIFGEASWTPTGTHNNLYTNAFWGIEEFSSAARDPAVGGPLGRVGILFAALGLGRYGAALGNDADNAVGGAVGYQMFFDHTRRQLIFELGGRTPTKDGPGQDGSVALGGRIQQALGQHFIVQLDAFIGGREGRDVIGGARMEFLVRF